MNSAVGPFLMKKLLKSGICGSMNNARVHCSPWKSQQMQAKKKKKKKKGKTRKKQNVDVISWIQTCTKYDFVTFGFVLVRYIIFGWNLIFFFKMNETTRDVRYPNWYETKVFLYWQK